MNAIVLLVCLTFAAYVAAGEEGRIVIKNGQKCTCRYRNCDDDISCEEFNCLCNLKALKALEYRKDHRYDKAWLVRYRKLVEKKCRCLKKCEKRCSDVAIEACTEHVWNQFICGYVQLISDILTSCNKDHFKAFINDIIELSTICIRKDCKPQCSGNAQCGTLLAKADIDCIKWAIAKTIKGLKDHDSIKHVQRLEKILIAHEKAKAACKANNKGPIARNTCLANVNTKYKNELKGFKAAFRSEDGHCSANNIIYTVEQLVGICVVQAAI